MRSARAGDWCTRAPERAGGSELLDAAECPPTFGVSPGQVVGVMAGGRRALWRAVEGAEDRGADARRALRRLRVGPRDVVCGICASGVTPFALAALGEGRRRGARTIVVTCAPSAALPCARRCGRRAAARTGGAGRLHTHEGGPGHEDGPPHARPPRRWSGSGRSTAISWSTSGPPAGSSGPARFASSWSSPVCRLRPPVHSPGDRTDGLTWPSSCTGSVWMPRGPAGALPPMATICAPALDEPRRER